LPYNTVEKILHKFETNFGLLMKKVNDGTELGAEDKWTLSMFVSLMEARTFAQRQNMEQFQQGILERVRQLEEQHGAAPTQSQEMIESITKNEMFITGVLTAIQLNRYQHADWQILEVYSDEVNFITSDNPVCHYDFHSKNSFYDGSPISKTLEVTFPLSKQYAVVGNYLGITGYKKVFPNEINEVNWRTMMVSHQEFYAGMKLEKKDIDGIFKRNRIGLAICDYINQQKTRVDIEVEQIEKRLKRAAFFRRWLPWLGRTTKAK